MNEGKRASQPERHQARRGFDKTLARSQCADFRRTRNHRTGREEAKGWERDLLFTQALKELARAQTGACDLFNEGATWERKFAGLEEACGTSTALDLETVAWLYWSCKRFFETGLPALVSIQKSVNQCEHCKQAVGGVPFAILYSTLQRLRDVLQHAGASMPDLCLMINETHGQA